MCINNSIGRSESQISIIEEYLKAVGLFRDYTVAAEDPVFSQIVELDLSTVVPSVSGPKRPHDRVAVSDFKEDFQQCLNNKVSHIIKSVRVPSQAGRLKGPHLH